MDRIVINLGDFLKNAGIVGLNYILEDVICAEKDKDYGYTPDRQAIWLSRDFALDCDWTDVYFKAFTKYYRKHSVYQSVIDEINSILAVIQKDNFKLKDMKNKLKFINDKLLSNSYKSLRKESKVVQTKKQYGDFSLTALSFASISIFSG